MGVQRLGVVREEEHQVAVDLVASGAAAEVSEQGGDVGGGDAQLEDLAADLPGDEVAGAPGTDDPARRP